MATIKQAAKDCASKNEDIKWYLPTGCLLGGLMWELRLTCTWNAGKQAVTVDADVQTKNQPAGTLFCCMNIVTCAGIPKFRGLDIFRKGGGWGVDDFFDLGFMSGEFDDDAWAAKGVANIWQHHTATDCGGCGRVTCATGP